MSAYGARVAKQLAGSLAEQGIMVISGFANGIDATAHAGTLERGGTTIAILPGGCDDQHIYPQNNLELAHQIIKQHGALISEYPPDTSNLRHHFPLRNRIIAGLSAATVVIEAAERSGSLITASLALQEHREVLAVPGPITSPQSAGTHQLIKMGATPCTDINDILEAIHLPRIDSPSSISKPQKNPAIQTNLTPDEERIISLLTTPKHIDDLGRALGVATAQTSSLVMQMELNGVIEHVGGQWFQARS
jgi:DNA processing protein